MRLTEAKKYCRKISEDSTLQNRKIEIIEGEYEDSKWFELAKGHENDPERGERCRICYEMRLAKTAETAAKKGFHAFTTTLSISPHKNSAWLNEIGENLEQKFGVKYLKSDWKKRDGFKQSLEISRKFNLNRQNYCGCTYSKHDTLRSKAKSTAA